MTDPVEALAAAYNRYAWPQLDKATTRPDDLSAFVLAALRASGFDVVPTGDVDGRAVHAAWRDGMLAQGREVAPERMAWETLTQQDRDLDDGIAARLRVPTGDAELDVERLARVFADKGWMLVDAAKMHDRYGLRLPGDGWAVPIAKAIAAEYARLSDTGETR